MTAKYFELLGLPACFAVDAKALEANFRAAQAQWHPDRFADRPAPERLHAMQTSADLNEAVRTLRDPVLRAVYLLKLQGVDAFDERDTAMTPTFLMQQIEWREALETCHEDMDALNSLRATLDKAEREMLAALSHALDASHDTALARRLTRELRFMQKFGEEIDSAEADIEDFA